MKVKLRIRLGQNPVGSVIDVSDGEAQWLVVHGKATWSPGGAKPKAEQAPEPDLESEPEPTLDRSMSLNDLRARAEGLGLPTYGKKSQLIERIDEAERTE